MILTSKKQSLFLLIPFLVLILLFFIVPLFYMVVSSFSNSDGFTLNQYKTVLTNSYILQGFKNSITLSAISALLALVVTLFAVYAMMRFPDSVRERILVVTNLLLTFQAFLWRFRSLCCLEIVVCLHCCLKNGESMRFLRSLYIVGVDCCSSIFTFSCHFHSCFFIPSTTAFSSNGRMQHPY